MKIYEEKDEIECKEKTKNISRKVPLGNRMYSETVLININICIKKNKKENKSNENKLQSHLVQGKVNGSRNKFTRNATK